MPVAYLDYQPPPAEEPPITESSLFFHRLMFLKRNIVVSFGARM
jgi:hypothetical protein